MRFDKYLSDLEVNNYHKDKEKIYDKFDKDINKINTHFIFYGKKNIGKYSQALHFINRYSSNNLKYYKKIQIDNGKFIYNVILSDVHYEIDFDYLTHTSKTFWFSIYNSILESAQINNDKKFIICKNFHKISGELLNIFYNTLNINNKFIFILLCETVCFFPDNLVDRCYIIGFSKSDRLTNDTIIKKNQTLSYHNEVILNLIKEDVLNLMKLRESIYDIFIKQYCIYDLIWYLLEHIDVSITTFETINKCCKLYNNNYRPIYHIERLILLIRENYKNEPLHLNMSIQETG
jgi:hypothetical protein